MLQQSDGYDHIEFLAVLQVTNVGDLEVNRHVVAVPHALMARGRIDSEKWIVEGKGTEAVRSAEGIVVHQHDLAARIHRRQLHCLVAIGCAEKQDARLLHIEAGEQRPLAAGIPHRVFHPHDLVPHRQVGDVLQGLFRLMQIQTRQGHTEVRLGLVLRLRHVGQEELMEGRVEKAPSIRDGERLLMFLLVTSPRARPLLGTIRPAHVAPGERRPIHRAHIVEQVGGLIAQIDAILTGQLVVTDVVARGTRSPPGATGLRRKGARAGGSGFGGDQRSHTRPGGRKSTGGVWVLGGLGASPGAPFG